MPGLTLPKATSFKPFKRPRADGHARRRPSSALASRELLLNSSEHPRIDYTGREETADNGLVKHYSRSLLNELGLTFGTKKSRKAIASQTENAISPAKPTALHVSSRGANTPSAVDSATTAVLESIAPSVNTMASREDLQKDIDASKPRPKANLDAALPGEVYPIDNLVGREEMRSLSVKEWEDLVRGGKGITTTSRYVCNRVQRIVEAGNVRKLKVLRYLQLLLDFFFSLSKNTKDGRRLPQRENLEKALGVSDFLVDRVQRRFADRGLWMTKWRVDNLLTHIAALSLTIDDFEVDIFDLKEDLKLETRE
ncbi:hypothetical protein GP486_003068 [Trichoglossum hirsutum]|uniref:Uncharacterized protein n=1 Tax=Trichoglossum hirsutum TaxID=265104 RepID=A0A9P8LDZ9_9PEZI|nr:hypothetical protein GP486_003068 [Trichoglossum hirsutum]